MHYIHHNVQYSSCCTFHAHFVDGRAKNCPFQESVDFTFGEGGGDKLHVKKSVVNCGVSIHINVQRRFWGGGSSLKHYAR